MKKQPRHLIFLPKSNRLSLRGEGRATLSARRTVPSPRWPPKDGERARRSPSPVSPSPSPLPLLTRLFIHLLSSFFVNYNTRRLSSRPLPAKGFLSVLSLNPHDRLPGEVTKSAPSYG